MEDWPHLKDKPEVSVGMKYSLVVIYIGTAASGLASILKLIIYGILNQDVPLYPF